MKRFTGHTEAWGKFVDVKINASDLVPASTEKYRGKSVFLSSVTDPYLPLEKKYKITRQVLKKLISLQPYLGVQTKSDLVVRDIDLFIQFDHCEVGITITTLDDVLRREVEPFTASSQKRVEVLKKLKSAEITTYVFVGPIFPFLTDWKQIIMETKEYVDFYMFENLNIRGSIWSSVKNWLDRKHPDLVQKYEEIYFSKNGYWTEEEEKIVQFCKEQGVECRMYFHHGKE